MAFENIDGVKIASVETEQVFLVGDTFTVFEGENPIPSIYNWADLKSVGESKTEFSFETADSRVYKIGFHLIPDISRRLRLRAIIEGNLAKHPSVEYRHLKRILMNKTNYTSCDAPSRAFVSKGVYNEKEISYSNVTLLNTRLGKIFILTGILITISVFLFCFFFIGDFMENYKYFIPISTFCGVIISMFIYIACAIMAKFIYATLLKADSALDREITFTVAEDGFSAIETELHTGYDLVRWADVAYFVETNYVFIIYKDQKSVFWLPKRLFSKERQREISDFIATRLNQK